MSLPIKEIISGLEKNIRAVLLNKEFDIQDAKMNIIDIMGAFKDLWEKLQFVFEKAEQIKKIENSTKKGEAYEEIITPEAENLYL